MIRLYITFTTRISAIILICQSLSGCSYFSERFKNIGRPPELNEVNEAAQLRQSTATNSTAKAHLTPQGHERGEYVARTNSLWKPGSRTFFRDQRARSVGDILKVKIVIQDQAKLDNKTERSRDSSVKSGLPNFLGLEKSAKEHTNIDPTKLLGVSGTSTANGSGKIDRKETVSTTVAATVVKILPSSNLLIHGTQEIRVNNEIREVTVKGVVRPEDISTDNSITIDQIAEARISYGGRGQVTDYQQSRYGSQVLDILAPF